MKILYKTLTVVMVVVSLLVCVAAVGYVTSPRFQTAARNCVVENTNPEFVEWVEVFQNQVGLIFVGTERERLESRLNHLRKTELFLEHKLSTEVTQTPWSRLIHGDHEKNLENIKSRVKSTKISLFWVKTKDKLKFW